MIPQNKIETSGKWLAAIFITILALRISSYFTVSESLAVARVLKLGVRLMLTGLCFAWLLNLRSQRHEFKLELTNILSLVFYTAYLFLGILSLYWTSSVSTSMLQLSMTIESLVFVYVFYQVWLYNFQQFQNINLRISRLLSVSITLITLVFVAGVFIAPDVFYRDTHAGEVARLGGFIINPNELGMLLVIGMGMSLYEMYRGNKSKFYWFALALMAWGLILTGSRSSLIAMLLVAALYLSLYKKVVLKMVMGLAGLAAIPFLVQKVIIKMGDISEVMSMTGRLPFWSDLLTYGFTKEPLLGYGFMRISYHDKFESINAYSGAMTHNTFIQVLLNLGLIGFTIVLLQMVLLGYSITTHNNNKLKLLAVSLLIPLLINSLTEFGIFGESNYGIMFYQLVILMFVFTLSQVQNKKLSPNVN